MRTTTVTTVRRCDKCKVQVASDRELTTLFLQLGAFGLGDYMAHSDLCHFCWEKFLVWMGRR